MATVQDIQNEIAQFKATVVSGVDSFVRQGHITSTEGDTFLATVGIDRPEDPEVTAARRELDALKARVRDAVTSRVGDSYRRDTALRTLGLA